jgi:hypothetical protein
LIRPAPAAKLLGVTEQAISLPRKRVGREIAVVAVQMDACKRKLLSAIHQLFIYPLWFRFVRVEKVR